jgi:hypothetical protein
VYERVTRLAAGASQHRANGESDLTVDVAFGFDPQHRPQAVPVRQLNVKSADRRISQNHVSVSCVLSWQPDHVCALGILPALSL